MQFSSCGVEKSHMLAVSSLNIQPRLGEWYGFSDALQEAHRDDNLCFTVLRSFLSRWPQNNFKIVDSCWEGHASVSCYMILPRIKTAAELLQHEITNWYKKKKKNKKETNKQKKPLLSKQRIPNTSRKLFLNHHLYSYGKPISLIFCLHYFSQVSYAQITPTYLIREKQFSRPAPCHTLASPRGEQSWKCADYRGALSYGDDPLAWTAHGFYPPRQGKRWAPRVFITARWWWRALWKRLWVSGKKRQVLWVWFHRRDVGFQLPPLSLGLSMLTHLKPNDNICFDEAFSSSGYTSLL